MRQQKSTGVADRKAAQKIADGYEKAHVQEQSETKIRQVMSTISEEVNGKPLCDHTLDTWLTHWLGVVKTEVKTTTLEKYEQVATLVRKFGKEACNKRLDRLEKADIETLRGILYEARSSATTNHTIKVLRMALNRAFVDGLIFRNPAVGVKKVKKNDDDVLTAKRQPFTADQIKTLLALADDERKGFILAGLFTAGQRIGDVASMTPSHVDLIAGTVKFVTTKTGRTTVIPIASGWRADLEKRMQGKGPKAPLFPHANDLLVRAQGRAHQVSNWFTRLLARAGLAINPSYSRTHAVEGRRRCNAYSFHSFRHTMTSLLKRANVADAIVRDLVGHESKAVSAEYTHIDEDTKRAAMERAAKDLNLNAA